MDYHLNVLDEGWMVKSKKKLPDFLSIFSKDFSSGVREGLVRIEGALQLDILPAHTFPSLVEGDSFIVESDRTNNCSLPLLKKARSCFLPANESAPSLEEIGERLVVCNHAALPKLKRIGGELTVYCSPEKLWFPSLERVSKLVVYPWNGDWETLPVFPLLSQMGALSVFDYDPTVNRDVEVVLSGNDFCNGIRSDILKKSFPMFCGFNT